MRKFLSILGQCPPQKYQLRLVKKVAILGQNPAARRRGLFSGKIWGHPPLLEEPPRANLAKKIQKMLLTKLWRDLLNGTSLRSSKAKKTTSCLMGQTITLAPWTFTVRVGHRTKMTCTCSGSGAGFPKFSTVMSATTAPTVT